MSTASLARGPLPLVTILAVLALGATASVLAGPVSSLLTAADDIAGYDPARMTLLYSTLPRLAMAVLCGGALAASGALLQQALRNPLASPTTLGIEAGGQLALALSTLFAPAVFGWGRDLVVLSGCLVSTLLVFALVRRKHFAAVSLILAGLVVGLYAGALSGILTLLNDRYLISLFIWGSGSLSQQSWEPFLSLLLRLALLLAPIVAIVRPLSILDLDDANARARGLDAGKLRFLAVLLAVILAAFVVSSVGVIGFVGLVAPILARLAGARRFSERIWLSAAIGALLLLLTDATVQLLSGVSDEFLPTGAVTAFLGSPILLLLLPRLGVADRPPSTEPVNAAPPLFGQRPLLGLGLMALGFALLLALALVFGRDPNTGQWSFLGSDLWREILPWRWPRILGAFSAGAMLGLAGFILQRLTGNEMASPEVLGVSAGAAFAAALALFAFGSPDASVISGAATFGSLGVIAVILVIGRRTGFQPERVLLAGIALNALLDAVVGLAAATADPRAIMLLAWMAGSTSGMTSEGALMAAACAAVFLTLSCLAVRWLAILPLGAASSRALGVPLSKARLALFALAAGLTGAAAPIVGPLTFVGLMAPHLARMLGLVRPLPALLASALAGGTLMIAADWVGRMAAFPWQLPTGLVAALIGAPCLMWLLSRERRTS